MTKKVKITQKGKKQRKEKVPPAEGINSKNLKRLTSANRLVWSQSSVSRRMAVRRATDENGFVRCEKCKTIVPKIFVDHIVPVGEVLSRGFFQRLWCFASGLQCLCSKCHAPKTRRENAERRARKRKSKVDMSDF